MSQLPKLGTMVKVRINNDYRRKSACAFMSATFEVKGKVYFPNSWDAPGSLRLISDTHSIRYPVIPGHAIISIEEITNDSNIINEIFVKEELPETRTYQVKSKRTNEMYTVTNDKGRWTCNCIAGLHNKICSHVKSQQTIEEELKIVQPV